MKRLTGFTLIETMVAVTILTLSITGPLLTASRATVAAEISRDKLTASYLAQEGIEYVRVMRDDEYLNVYKAGGVNMSTAAWTAFITGGDAASIVQCIATPCTLDPTRAMGFPPAGNSLAAYVSNAPLYLMSNGIYTQQQLGTKTSFTRTVQAFFATATDERIVSTVSWDFHGTTYTVTVTDHLTPWQ